MKIALILLLMLASCAGAAPIQPIGDDVVRQKAEACGIKSEQLKVGTGIDGKREWIITPSGNLDQLNFGSVKCFIEWGMQQRGVRIGFISEPPEVSR